MSCDILYRRRTVSDQSFSSCLPAIVAMIMLYVWAFNLAWGPLAWACATELSHGKNKTKIMSVGTAGFWICAWAVTFTLPYLFDDEKAGLGPMVGWIYAGGGAISVAFVYFCIPETLGRSLEEISVSYERCSVVLTACRSCPSQYFQVMMDLGVPTRAWKNYRVGNLEQSFGEDEFRSSAKRGKMNRGQSYHVENPKVTKEEAEAEA